MATENHPQFQIVPLFLNKSVANLVKSDCRLAKDISGPTIFVPPGTVTQAKEVSNSKNYESFCIERKGAGKCSLFLANTCNDIVNYCFKVWNFRPMQGNRLGGKCIN